MRLPLFCLGAMFVVVPEIFRVYYIMPFPASQQDVPTDLRQVSTAYWLHNNIWWIRLAGVALMTGPFLHYMKSGGAWRRLAVLVTVALCVVVFYAFNYKFMADKMFLPPTTMVMGAPVPTDSTTNDLVIVVEHNGEVRAYPIELIGYHHQVSDTVGGKPVLVTYCTVCRTGRAWDPVVDGRQENFRLVGMDHFNAMFEDRRTGSWWRQATGECIVGPLKGQQLVEVPSQQMTLRDFVEAHPKGLVMHPDPNFTEQYKGLAEFDEGTIDSDLEYRDTTSWQPKSWVVGVVHNGAARAYDWNDLTSQEGLVHDTLGSREIFLAKDSLGLSVQVFGYVGSAFGLNMVDSTSGKEYNPGSWWPIRSYQEFWHSWRTFHPNTTRYVPKR